MAKKDETLPKCSFCGKGHDEVKKLIAGPSIYICNECVTLCNEIIADAYHTDIEGHTLPKLPTPREIHHFLNDYVISQERAKNAALEASGWRSCDATRISGRVREQV